VPSNFELPFPPTFCSTTTKVYDVVWTRSRGSLSGLRCERSFRSTFFREASHGSSDEPDEYGPLLVSSDRTYRH